MQQNKNKNTKILMSLMMAFAIIISFIAGYFVKFITTDKTSRLVAELLKVAKSQSTVLDVDITSDEIAKKVVEKLLEEDKYAVYYTKEEYKRITAEGSGNYTEIGIILYSNTPVVFRAVGNSPAKKAGIKQNDKILSVKTENQQEFVEITSSSQFNDIVLNAELNKNITIKVLRAGEVLEFNINKTNYQASYVTYVDNSTLYTFESVDVEKPMGISKNEGKNTLLDDTTAIITLDQFEGDAANQFASALNFMFSQNRHKLILDLRDNGGGYMHILLDIASYLIKNNGINKTEIAYAKGKTSSQLFLTNTNNFNENLKEIVVLANHNTASASECLIGAMLYYGDCNFSFDRLLITKNPTRDDYSTYGKGIMQTTYLISTGGAFKLTTANILWPNRKTCIHEIGIKQTKEINQVTNDNAILRATEILKNL